MPCPHPWPKAPGPFLPHIWDASAAWAQSFYLRLSQFPSWLALEGLGYSTPLMAPKQDLEAGATDTGDGVWGRGGDTVKRDTKTTQTIWRGQSGGDQRPLSPSRTESEMAFYWKGHLSPWPGIVSLMNPEVSGNTLTRCCPSVPPTKFQAPTTWVPHHTGDLGHIHRRLRKGARSRTRMVGCQRSG